MSKFIKGLLILAVIFIVVYFGSIWYFKQVVLREEARVKAAGEPVTQKELLPPEIPEAQNAAIYYQQALLLAKQDKIKLSNQANIQLQQVNQDWIRLNQKPEGLAELLDLKSNKEALKLLVSGLSRPGCRYSDNFYIHPDLENNKDWRLANLAARQAGWFMVNGDYPQAETILAAGLKFGNSLPYDNHTSFAVKFACLSNLSRPLEILVIDRGYRLNNPVLKAEIGKIPARLNAEYRTFLLGERVGIFEFCNKINGNRSVTPLLYYTLSCGLKTFSRALENCKNGSPAELKEVKYPLQIISARSLKKVWNEGQQTAARYQKIAEAMEKKP